MAWYDANTEADWLRQAAQRKNGLNLQIWLGAGLTLLSLALVLVSLAWPLLSSANLITLGVACVVNRLGAPLLRIGLREKAILQEQVRLMGFGPLPTGAEPKPPSEAVAAKSPGR